MVSVELVNELKKILFEEYGLDLPIKEVDEIGNTLVSYFYFLTVLAGGNNKYEQQLSKNN